MSETATKPAKRGRPRCFQKDKALERALGVFLEHGYEGCSIDNLTDALGINRPSLYAAFGNKERLFITVLEKYHRNYIDYFQSLVAEGLPPKETARKWLAFFIENFESQKQPLGCLVVNSTLLASDSYPEVSKELKSLHNQNEKLLKDYFQSEIEKGRLTGDAASLSQYFNAVVQGMAVLHRTQGNRAALANIASSAMNAWPE